MDIAQLRLSSDFIAIQHVDAPATSGIILLERDTSAPKYAKVVSVGPGRTSESGHLFPMEYKAGDLLMLNGNPGSDVKVGAGVFRFIRPGDVYGIVNP